MINDYEDIGTSGNYLKGVLGDVLQPDSGKKILKQPTAKRSQETRKKRRQHYKSGLNNWIRGDSEIHISNIDETDSDKQKSQKLPEVEERRKSRKLTQGRQKNKYELQKLFYILRFILDEFAQQGKQLLKPLGLFYEWQILNLAQNFQDTNIGDFIIKLPNPDNLSDEYNNIFDKLQEEGNHYFTIDDAQEMYNDLFDLQQTTSIYQSNLEKIAFNVGFYLINLKQRYQQKQLQKQIKFVHTFFQNYSYYNKIKKLQLVQYLKIKQSPEIYKEQEKLMEEIRSIIEKIDERCSHFEDQQFQNVNNLFKQYKEEIYLVLEQNIGECYDDIGGRKATTFLIESPSIIDFFEDFPKFATILIDQADNLDENERRKVCKGEYLVKSIVEDQLVWQIKNRRPQDLLTLFRKFILYSLSQRGKLFTRTFLAKNEKEFFVLVKSSEEVMQEYAQNNEISMQVELGSTDLFSFQPVDSCLRPLRVHPYIRDRSFRRKYNLDFDKKDKDEELGQISIQSEAPRIYKKGQGMNKQELRAKIILDQEEVDECYIWLSKRLGVSFIKHDDVIFNKYNDEVIDEDIWEIYYVYNKFIIEYVKRVQKLIKFSDPKSTFIKVLNANLGLLLRLMFTKALYLCNDLYYNERQIKGITPRFCSNLFKSKKTLSTIWDSLNAEVPKGFWSYIKIQKLQRLWKKYEINELKDRSKFFPSQRLALTNKIVRSTMNISRSIKERYILDYYPLHDPFLLKGIKLSPYLNVIKSLVLEKKINNDPSNQNESDGGINSLFDQYASKYTKLDFTNQSIQEKLQAKCGKLSYFSIDTVRYYCGTKLAFYFEYMRFLSSSAVPYFFIALIFQMVFWVEISQILETGTSILSEAVSILIVITTFLNIIWTTITVQKWRKTQKQLAQAFGVSNKKTEDGGFKRVQFEGDFKRNFKNDEMNYEYVTAGQRAVKSIFTFLINIIFVVAMALTIIQIFVLKVYLYQTAQDPQIVNNVPAILISLAIKIFNFLYTKLIYTIMEFENHKTINQYEASLVSKSYIITFIVTFYSIIVYGYFAEYIEAEFLCLIKTTTGNQIVDCPYFMINQLQTFVIVDFIMTIVAGFTPFLTFKIGQLLQGNSQPSAKFNVNQFESIDQFYEEQDKMSSYMYDDELDRSWLGYIKFISLWSSLAMFGNALPLTYVTLYLTGLVGTHAGKYQIIYFSKRTIPVNRNQSSHWLRIMEVVSFISILSNLAYMIYVREVFTSDQGSIFFFMIVLILIFKYCLRVINTEEDDKMNQRNRIKTFNLINDKGLDYSQNKPETLDLDITDVIYDEERLQRKFPKFSGANVRVKNQKKIKV